MAYRLQSDNDFIRATAADQRIFANPEHKHFSPHLGVVSVYRYDAGGSGDQKLTVEMPMNAPLYEWTHLASIGSTATYKQLGVNGVIFLNQWLSYLAGDLTPVGKDGQKFTLMVNRQGLCIIDISGDTGPMKWLRINDRFGWSKYGVKVPRDGLATWSVCDMHNGTVLVDCRKRKEEKGSGGVSSSHYYLEAP